MEWDWLLLLLTGTFAGLLGSLVGLGGGIVVVPVLLFFSHVFPAFSHITPAVAAGTGLVIVLLTGLSSTLSYTKQRRVDFKSGFLFFVGSGPGALLGAAISRLLDVDVFYILFGGLIVTVAFMLRRKNRQSKRKINWKIKRTYTNEAGVAYEFGYSPVTAIVVSFGIGFISSLFGIGGGALFVPLMILLFRYPPHLATATSMFVISLSAATGSVAHIFLGHVYWWAVLWLAPGAWIGASLGAALSKRMKASLLVTVMQVVLVLIGLRMIVSGLIT